MIDMGVIQAAAERLAAAGSSSSRIILFGSCARGTAKGDSDPDSMVLEPEMTSKAGEYLRLRNALGRVAPGAGVDLLIHPQ